MERLSLEEGSRSQAGEVTHAKSEDLQNNPQKPTDKTPGTLWKKCEPHTASKFNAHTHTHGAPL